MGFFSPSPRRDGWSTPDEYSQLVTIQFKWDGLVKHMGSSFIGVSPAFELALYTLCYLAGEEVLVPEA